VPQACTVCNHAEREKIDAALVASNGSRVVAELFGVSNSSVDRHRRIHIPQIVLRAKSLRKIGNFDSSDFPAGIDSPASIVVQADNILAALQAHAERAERLIVETERGDSWQARIAALRENRETIVLRARLAGILVGDAASVNVDNRSLKIYNVMAELSEDELRAIAGVSAA